MTIDEIALELELAGLSREQQNKLLSFCKTNGFDAKVLDQKLQLMGFEPVFSIYEEIDDAPAIFAYAGLNPSSVFMKTTKKVTARHSIRYL